jgi:tetratricopeptide (TPR) repeat protein
VLGSAAVVFLFLLIYNSKNPEVNGSFLMLLLNGCLLISAYYLIIPLHELGHAIVGRVVGVNVLFLQWGRFGRPVWATHIGVIPLYVYTLPFNGATIGCLDPECRFRRLKKILYSAGGMLVNAAIVFLILVANGPGSLDPSRLSLHLNLPWAVATASCYQFVCSALPFGSSDLPTDGRKILGLLVGRHLADIAEAALFYLQEGQPEKALQYLQKAASPENDRDLFSEILESAALADLNRHAEAVEILQPLLREPQSTAIIAHLKHCIAWSLMLNEGSQSLKETRRFIDEVRQYEHVTDGIKHTYACFLVEDARPTQALPLLEEALGRVRRANLKAITLAYLALAHEQLDDRQNAERFWIEARETDPTCILLSRRCVASTAVAE